MSLAINKNMLSVLLHKTFSSFFPNVILSWYKLDVYILERCLCVYMCVCVYMCLSMHEHVFVFIYFIWVF